MHPSADRRNVSRTILRTLAAADLRGAEIVPDGDPRGPSAGATRWIRVTMLDGPSAYAGRDTAGVRHAMTRILLSVECYVADGADDAVFMVDDVEALASVVVDALRFVDMPLLDLVTDPTGATPVTGYALRAAGAPRVAAAPTVDGYQRRSVLSELVWIAKES